MSLIIILFLSSTILFNMNKGDLVCSNNYIPCMVCYNIYIS